jgi:hypothetical protein
VSASPPESNTPLSAYALQGLSVADTNRLKDATVRRHVTYLIVGAFVAVNVLTYLGIGWMYSIDQAELAQHVVTPTQRIITTEIVATAVGATTVQLGFLAILIGRYLFPRSDAADEPEPQRLRNI